MMALEHADGTVGNALPDEPLPADAKLLLLGTPEQHRRFASELG